MSNIKIIFLIIFILLTIIFAYYLGKIEGYCKAHNKYVKKFQKLSQKALDEKDTMSYLVYENTIVHLGEVSMKDIFISDT